jgi:serine protease Do
MNKRLLPLVLLAAGFAATASAQTGDKVTKEKNDKEQSITIRKKGDNKEKLTIVIDGDNITLNGKPLEEMKDADIQVLRNQGITSLMPKIRGRLAPMGSLKMFGEDFPMGGNRAFLGVTTEKNEKGAKVNAVEKESAAEKIGLKKDDIITKVDEDKISDSQDLYETIGKHKPEDKVSITYLRDGKEATTTATLGKTSNVQLRSFNFNSPDNENFRFEMPDMPRMNGMDILYNRKPRLGMEIQDMEEGKGVKVLDVDKDTPAAKAGLQKDDVIVSIDGTAVNSVDELRNKVRELKEGESLKFTFNRGGKTQSAEVKIPKKIKTAEL